MLSFINVVKHPVKDVYKILWIFEKKKLKQVGKNVKVGPHFDIYGNEFISIGDNFVASERLRLNAWNSYNGEKTDVTPELIIMENVNFNDNCYISCANKIVIESGVLFGSNVFVCDNSHGQNSLAEIDIPPAQRKLYSKGPVHIGRNVWLGRNVCVMPGVTIGENSVIGANAVVTHDIPPGSIAAGAPARVIKPIQ